MFLLNQSWLTDSHFGWHEWLHFVSYTSCYLDQTNDILLVLLSKPTHFANTTHLHGQLVLVRKLIVDGDFKQKFQVFLNKMRPDLILGPWRRDISNTQWQSVLYILNLFTVPLNKEGLLAILYQVYMLFQSCIEESSKMIIYKKTKLLLFSMSNILKA